MLLGANKITIYSEKSYPKLKKKNTKKTKKQKKTKKKQRKTKNKKNNKTKKKHKNDGNKHKYCFKILLTTLESERKLSMVLPNTKPFH